VPAAFTGRHRQLLIALSKISIAENDFSVCAPCPVPDNTSQSATYALIISRRRYEG
jgi:hypothetical protein